MKEVVISLLLSILAVASGFPVSLILGILLNV